MWAISADVVDLPLVPVIADELRPLRRWQRVHGAARTSSMSLIDRHADGFGERHNAMRLGKRERHARRQHERGESCANRGC